ncbi:MAG: DASS family sodium-coupled anion symporter [Bacteroidia bacterium]|nr:DASS family sodium-coupled anion symporter [Bacteroidia bacterium]
MEYPKYKQFALIAGPLLCLSMAMLPIDIISPKADAVLGVALWMVMWWVTETVSISVTALIPLAIFPLLDILGIKEVANAYGNHIIFLFFGGFVIALAMEKVNLHRRIALTIIGLTGTHANGIVLGFMLSTALLSMWISNTASTVLMLPIATSVISLLINDKDGFTKNDQNFAMSIMLGIAFSANIGGMGTIIGTPPTSFLVGFLEKEHDITLGFLNWMVMGVPLVLIMLAVNYWVVVKWFYPNRLGKFESSSKLIEEQIKELGPLRKEEALVLVIFVMTALLWIFRSLLNETFNGLDLSDTGISVLGALAMFVVPQSFDRGKFSLDWRDTQKLPWGILILFGGGLALAGGMKESGIIDLIADAVRGQESLSSFAISAILICIMLFMTEIMSNVALVTIFVPVVAGIAIGLDMPMIHVLIPLTLASSCAFMLPMATPPNAIVFASGHIRVYQMARVGFIMNVLSIIVLIGVGQWIVPLLF